MCLVNATNSKTTVPEESHCPPPPDTSKHEIKPNIHTYSHIYIEKLWRNVMMTVKFIKKKQNTLIPVIWDYDMTSLRNSVL